MGSNLSRAAPGIGSLQAGAFHNDAKMKERHLALLQVRIQAGELQQNRAHLVPNGRYSNALMCSLVCTTADHWSVRHQYEETLGIPLALVRFKEQIFQGLPADQAIEWPLKFLSAIPVGADLSSVERQFVDWLLAHPETGVIRHAATEEQREVILRAAKLYRLGPSASVPGVARFAFPEAALCLGLSEDDANQEAQWMWDIVHAGRDARAIALKYGNSAGAAAVWTVGSGDCPMWVAAADVAACGMPEIVVRTYISQVEAAYVVEKVPAIKQTWNAAFSVQSGKLLELLSAAPLAVS